MEKLERIKKEYEESLLELKAGSKNSLDKIVGLDTLDKFMNHYRTMVLNDMPVDQKKQMISKFVKKIEADTDRIKIHFIVDDEHYQQELALQTKSPNILVGPNYFSNFGSCTLIFKNST